MSNNVNCVPQHIDNVESQSVEILKSTDNDSLKSTETDELSVSNVTKPDKSVTDLEVNVSIHTKENEPTEIKFDILPENDFEKKKRCEIEAALKTKTTTLERWRQLAREDYGLVNDDLRRKVWPLLMNVDPDITETPPTLEELSQHPEYNQVILDVNRSLKRFPPGIPYEQRVALQDQLTVLILRVIMKYPYLRYYQGYHDVAITFLLVVGDAVAFRIMECLSTVHLRECMEPTMEKTSHRLNFIYPIIEREHVKLFEFLERSSVGTIFALPWYLTWFGHSLNQYRDVVRLYDYFLASPPLSPLYVAAALIIHREKEIFSVDCDMAGIHCLLTTVPDNLPFETILIKATNMYEKYPPEDIEKDVQKRIKREMEARKRDEERARKRQLQRRPRGNIWLHLQAIERFVPAWIPRRAMNKYKMLVVSVSVAVGVYAYYLRNNETYSLLGR